MGTLSNEFPDTSFSSDNGTTATAGELKEKISSRVQSMLDGASEKLSGAKARVSSAASTARTTAGEKVESVGDIMHRHPIATIAIGLGVGYIIGRLMARS
ncbi:MAG TPA: DUF883 C-terminal domain-containing protein [Kofleriaceae bacterium]|nr:DUF883 C-terminal domain-containing protein [Kofleriaceae bacterium]